MLHYCYDTVIKLIVQLQKKQYPAQGRSMEIPMRFRGGGGKKSKNLKRKLEFPKCGGGGFSPKTFHKGPDINISATCQFYKAKNSISKKISKFNWIILMTQK